MVYCIISRHLERTSTTAIFIVDAQAAHLRDFPHHRSAPREKLVKAVSDERAVNTPAAVWLRASWRFSYYRRGGFKTHMSGTEISIFDSDFQADALRSRPQRVLGGSKHTSGSEPPGQSLTS